MESVLLLGWKLVRSCNCLLRIISTEVGSYYEMCDLVDSTVYVFCLDK